MKIPFNKLHLTGEELDFISDALQRESISGDGYYNKMVTQLLEEILKSKVYTVTSGTHALELAMLLIGIQEGDEVILPSYTFSSTANAIKLFGGRPVFVDVYEDSLTINIEEVEKLITENSKAIIPVHYGGIGCQMDRIMELAKEYKLFVVEDAAQVLGAKFRGKPLGTWGHIGCFSFHGTKNIVSGEGGGISININEPTLYEQAEVIRQKGTNRHRFLRGEIDRYTWVDIGSSYAPSDLLMAMLYPQLRNIEDVIGKRKKISDSYEKALQPYIRKGVIRSMSSIPPDFQSNYHNFYILLRDLDTREFVRQELLRREIQAYIHFVPLHGSPMGLRMGYKPSDLPVTQRVGDTLLRLPLYTDMNGEELQYVTHHLNQILGGVS